MSKLPGIRWEKIESGKPPAGKEIICEGFAKGQSDFTQDHFDASQIEESDLTEYSYICVGDSYFKPVRTPTGTDISDEDDAKALIKAIRNKKTASGALGRIYKWLPVGDIEPTTGHNLQNSKLAEALRSKTEFTVQEWEAFGIEVLPTDHFIKSGDSFFQPAGQQFEFSSDELDFKSLLFQELSYDSYIKVDDTYFRPVRGKYSKNGKEGRIPVSLETFLKVGTPTQCHTRSFRFRFLPGSA